MDPKDKKNAYGQKKKAIVKSMYNLRNMTILEELVKKKLDEPERKENKRNKYHKVYLRKNNSPIVLFDSPSEDEANIDSRYNHYLLSLVIYEESDEEGVMVPPVSS